MAYAHGQKINDFGILLARLDDAADAIRDFDLGMMSAAAWREKYPEMAKLRGIGGEDYSLRLHRELVLRMAELLATGDHDHFHDLY